MVLDSAMSDSAAPRARLPGLLLVLALCVALLAAHLPALEFESPSYLAYVRGHLPVFLLGHVLPSLPAVGVAAAALALYAREFSAFDRLAAWCLVGAVTIGVTGGGLLAYQLLLGVPVRTPFVLLADLASVGAFFGFLVGVYDYRFQSTLRELHCQRERVEELNDRLTVLNRVLRHDGRNATNVILGYSDVLSERVDAEVDEELEAIERSAERLQRVSEQARTLETVLNRDPETQTEVLDVTDVVSDALDRVTAAHPELTVHRRLPSEARARALPVFPSAVENALENAVEHNDTDDPAVWVRVWTRRDGDPGTVAVELVDDGPGISADTREILESGREGPLEHTDGLGLWIINWIVEGSGGRVSIEADGSEGTRLVLELPGPASASEPTTRT